MIGICSFLCIKLMISLICQIRMLVFLPSYGKSHTHTAHDFNFRILKVIAVKLTDTQKANIKHVA